MHHCPLLRAAVGSLLGAALPLLAQTTPPASPPEVRLSPFEISVEEDQTYRAVNSITASRLPTALRDTPLTLNVVTEELLRDLGATSIQDALEYVSGVRQRADTENAFFIRGQRVNYFTRNGFLRYDFVNTANVQRVEVIKGPAALLFGTSSPGGLINYVTKRPLTFNRTTVTGTIGTEDRYGLSVDTTGPIWKSGPRSIGYRLIASYDEGGSVVRTEDRKNYVIAPSLSFQIFENTSLFLEYEHGFKENSPWSDNGRPTFNVGNRFFSIPTSQLPLEAGNAPNAFKKQDNDTFTAELVQRVGDWNARLAFNYYQRDERALRYNIDNNVNNDLTLNASGGGPYWNRRFRNWDYNTQLDITGRVETGPVLHRLLIGGQSRIGDFQDDVWRFNPANTSMLYDRAAQGGLPRFAITNVPNLPSADQFDPVFWQLNFREFQEQELYGAYLSDTISVWEDRLIVLLGVRHTTFKVRQAPRGRGPNTTATVTAEDRFTQRRTVPQYGMSFRVIDPVTVYALYSESFLDVAQAPQRQPDGTRVDPQRGEGIEAGLKTEFFQGKLGVNLAWFDTKRANITQAVPNTSPTQFLQIAEQTTQGVEGDIYFALVPGWSFVANFQHVYTFETSGSINALQIGQPLEAFNSEPEWGGSLFTKYEFQEGLLKGLAIGGGMSFQSTRDVFQGTPAVRVAEREAFEEFTGLVEYNTKVFGYDTQFVLNVRNLLDDEFERAPRIIVQPRSVNFSTRIAF